MAGASLPWAGSEGWARLCPGFGPNPGGSRWPWLCPGTAQWGRERPSLPAELRALPILPSAPSQARIPALWPLLRPGQHGHCSQPCSGLSCSSGASWEQHPRAGGCSISLGMGPPAARPARIPGVASLLCRCAGIWEDPGRSGRAGMWPRLRVHPGGAAGAAPGPALLFLSSSPAPQFPAGQIPELGFGLAGGSGL